jgi:hypothetical protein
LGGASRARRIPVQQPCALVDAADSLYGQLRQTPANGLRTSGTLIEAGLS